jgi:hypothetical protein
MRHGCAMEDLYRVVDEYDKLAEHAKKRASDPKLSSLHDYCAARELSGASRVPPLIRESVLRNAGIGMTSAQLATRYRLHAADCIKLAQSIAEAAGKLSLLNMAQAWVALAEQADKNGATALVYETPVAPPRSPEQS